MNLMMKQMFGCTVVGLVLALSGCGNNNNKVDTPAERAGANAADATRDAASATGAAARDAADATGNAAKALANDVTGNQPMDGTKSEAREIADEVGDEIKDATNEVRDFFVEGQGSDAERLHEFIEQVDEQLEEYADRIEDEQDNTVRTGYSTTYQGLRTQRDELNEQWENLKDASAEQWGDAKAGLNNAMNKLNREMREFGNNFRDAVTPDPAPTVNTPPAGTTNTPPAGGTQSPATGS